jgi:hypothetical protein
MNEQWREAFGLFADPNTAVDSKSQIAVLRRAVVSLAQDVAVLRQILEREGLLSAAGYRKLRIDRMVDDHNGAGAAPWLHHSYFPHLLGEEEFLRVALEATDSEVEAFRKDADFVSQLS